MKATPDDYRLSILETLAATIYTLTMDALPVSVLAQYRLRLIDYLAAYLSGTGTPASAIFRDLSNFFTSPLDPQAPRTAGTPTATRVTHDSVLHVAANYAATAHAAEVDDVHLDVTGLHPGVTVIPAVLAIAEAESLHGRTVLESIVVGYEVGARIGAAITPSHRLRGFHATGTIGVIAASAAVSKALQLSQAQFVSALSLATSLAGGTFAMLQAGSGAKPLHAAHASMMGIYSAQAARFGLRGASAALEAPDGFFEAYADALDLSRLHRPLGRPWEVARVMTKPYPCCAHAFGVIDLALELRSIIVPDSVERVDVHTYHVAAVLSDETPRDAVAAKFSLPYLFALALLEGHISEGGLSPSNPAQGRILELAAKVHVAESAEANERFPGERLTQITVTTTDRNVLQRETKTPTGMPPRMLTPDQIRRKLEEVTQSQLGSASHLLLEHVEAIGERPAWANELTNILEAMKGGGNQPTFAIKH